MGSVGKERGETLEARGYDVRGGTHYETLKVSSLSTLAEIRANYRAALLALHPDKLNPQFSQHSEDNFSTADGILCGSTAAMGVDISPYLRVQEAWNILRNADSRAVYDATLKAHGASKSSRKGDLFCVIGEEIVLEDMEEGEGETTSTEYWYPCRCSDFYMVGQRELEEAGLESGEMNLDRDTGGKKVHGEGEAASEPIIKGRGGENEEGTEWGRQRRSFVLPCLSCSLHLRVYFWAFCP